MSIAEIRNAISDLPEFERGTLAAWLLDALPPHGYEDASAEGIEEAARRRDEVDSGKVWLTTATEDGHDFFAIGLNPWCPPANEANRGIGRNPSINDCARAVEHCRRIPDTRAGRECRPSRAC